MRTKILLLALLALSIQNIVGFYYFNEAFAQFIEMKRSKL